MRLRLPSLGAALPLAGRLLLLTAPGLPIAAAAGGPPSRPNVVFLLCDDLGYGDLGCFASEKIRTPHLDRLAREGLKLTACYAGMPVCSPSRGAFLTGRNAHRLGIKDWIPPGSGVFLKRDEVTLARALRDAGYRTAHVGKWHLNSRMDGTEPTPGDHGFEHWFATQNNAAPSHQDPGNFVRNGAPVGPLQGNATTLVVDEALRFLDAAPEGRGQPFFLNVWFHAPHEPIAVPEAFRAAEYPGEPDPLKADYYASVTLIDREVGRLRAELERRGLARNTFLFFTSDNGPETLNRYRGAQRSHGSPGPLRGMKLHVTEAGIRVPGLVHWPGHTRPGRISAEPVAAFDLLPTVCEMARVPVPAGRTLDGVSFLPVLRGERLRRERPLFWQYDRAIGRPWTLALRQGDWKLLADAERRQFALFDLANDLGERRDLAAEQPERARELAAVLERLHADVNGAAR